MEQPIYIVGLGNLGKYVAYALGRSHGSQPPTRLLFHRLGLLDRWKEAGRDIRYSAHFGQTSPDSGYPPAAGFIEELMDPAVTEDKQAIWQRHPHVKIAPMEPITYLIVATKAHATISALSPIKDRLTRDSHIVFLQNGMGITDLVSKELFPEPETRPTYWAAICQAGVYSTSPFRIVHAGRGPLMVGVVGAPPATSPSAEVAGRALVETLQSANSGMLEVEGLEPGAILQAQLAKLVVNSILNPLTALCGCKTGQLFNNQNAKTLYSRLLPEAGVIVRALLPREDLKDAFSDEALDALVMRVVRQVANNTSSMLQDIQAGRRTEIDYINRYLVTQAQRLGLPHAHHSAMCRAITLLEAKARRNADL